MTEENKVDIDPRLLKFRWDLNAECNYEELTGKPILSEDGTFRIDLRNSRNLKDLLYAGLKSNVPGLTPEVLGGLITAENAIAVYTMAFEKICPRPKAPIVANHQDAPSARPQGKAAKKRKGP